MKTRTVADIKKFVVKKFNLNNFNFISKIRKSKICLSLKYFF